jgi:hypothetical protein
MGLLVGLGDFTGEVAGTLLGRVGLAREQRLVDEEIARFDEPAIGGDDVAGRELYDIARRQLLEVQLARAPSRSTSAIGATERRSASTAFCACTS